MSCCGIIELISRIKTDATGNPIIEPSEEDFVMVEYIGGNRQKRQVGSPTQALRKHYGFQPNHYGQHKHGDVFAIHKDDLKAYPKLFKEVKEAKEKAKTAKKEDEPTGDNKTPPADKQEPSGDPATEEKAKASPAKK